MTDITELAQSLKAAAEKLDGAHWQTRKGFSGIEVIVKGSLEKRSGFTSFQPVAADLSDTKTARAIALFSPANVLALVDALEKAQHEAAVDWEAAASLNVENQELKRRIAELESRTVKLPPRAPENLACCLYGYEKWLIATTFRDTWNKCLDEVMRMGGAGIKWEGE
ncbi:TPA: ead/Ea22-like family protein [Raoultella planticola]